jgi:4-amino-4-deoxy-L-arabinose transferase-like glycosyltransferase
LSTAPGGIEGPPQNRGGIRISFYITLVALVVRLVVVGFVYPYWLNPKRDYYEFGYEPGRVARSLALGQGVSNPLHGTTGPTALVMPVYPAILAGCFKLFGIYSKGAAIAILSLNSLISALTCIPIFLIGRRSFDERTAKIATWIWAFFPNAIYFSANWIWATCLITLFLAVLFLMVLYLQGSSSGLAWFGFGLGCGVAALTEPNATSVLPFLGGWACNRLHKRARRWIASPCLAALAFVVVVSPWFVRNYEVFHRFIPFRDGLGLELYVGNNSYTKHWANGSIRPSNSAAELTEYAQSGELAYMAHKQQQALRFIREHRTWFVGMTLRRMLYLWTGFWSFRSSYLAEEPMDPPNIVLNVALLTLVVAGLRRCWRENRGMVAPYLLLFLFFPVVYCVTHPEVYYMRPLDPFLVLLAAYAIAARGRRGRNAGVRHGQAISQHATT